MPSGWIASPRLIRHDIHLHPLAVIVAVLSDAELNGVAGIYLAIPTVAIASVVYHHWIGWRDDEANASA